MARDRCGGRAPAGRPRANPGPRRLERGVAHGTPRGRHVPHLVSPLPRVLGVPPPAPAATRPAGRPHRRQPARRAGDEQVFPGRVRDHSQRHQRKARPLGDRVRFAGAVFTERPDYYGTADLYLCPTTKASFGITLLEAMASGTPMIVSDITGFRELVDGGAEAVLVPKGDPAAWAGAAAALIGDPARRGTMGAAGLAKAARYAWPRVADRVLAVYERVKR
ncbi:MAG: hypothetical protein DMD74_12665 [Gemmatimonadetes bacterium]|nr:MAG: hypothetical protein DMD74_12665 [Gemmatimonadota bacterium]